MGQIALTPEQMRSLQKNHSDAAQQLAALKATLKAAFNSTPWNGAAAQAMASKSVEIDKAFNVLDEVNTAVALAIGNLTTGVLEMDQRTQAAFMRIG